MTDREMLEWAAKAADIKVWPGTGHQSDLLFRPATSGDGKFGGLEWNPLTDDGDRYRLAKKLGISIDFEHRCTWKRLASGEVIQVWWVGKFDDEARAVVNVAAEIGKAKE